MNVICRSILSGIFKPKLSQVLNPKIFHLCFVSTFKMDTKSLENSSPDSVLTPPSQVRGMIVLDRDKFKKSVEIPYVVVPANKMKFAMKILKPYLLKIRKLNPVCKEDSTNKRILLHPDQSKDKLLTVLKTPEDLSVRDISWTKVNLDYENWSSEDIFKAILPEDSVGNVSSFSIIGHVIHLNLKEEILDYKFLIGQVLFDKYSNIRTVVNKCETIDNTFRNFKMEHLVGDKNYQVLVKENGFQYTFDFEKVFWNPRLGSEHNEMAKKMDSRDVVYDVFAGVGPFAIPIAKKGCIVHANDLNPDSYHWLCHNAKLNKVQRNISTYNLDGHDFIRKIVKDGLIKHFNGDEENAGDVHILMNLPALALSFLKSFNGLLEGETVKNGKSMPIVHCYFFKRKEEDAVDVLSAFLDADSLKDANITNVRVVAPNKLMMRISYRLLKTVLFPECEPLAKRVKLSDEHNLL